MKGEETIFGRTHGMSKALREAIPQEACDEYLSAANLENPVALLEEHAKTRLSSWLCWPRRRGKAPKRIMAPARQRNYIKTFENTTGTF
jgi:hypothetical protein